MDNITLRPARESDFPAIKSLIHASRINPTGLDWRRFWIAETPSAEFVGCGQVKPHADSTRELASIAVTESMRGRGIARLLIQKLLDLHPRPLYLTCRADLQPFYEKFGFKIVPETEMPRYFQRIFRLTSFARAIHLLPRPILVMRLDNALKETS